MPSIGFAAYLKLIALNPKPRDTELRKKLLGEGGGYDFHHRIKRASRRYVFGEATMAELEAEAEEIQRASERTAYSEGLAKLETWRKATPGEALLIPSKVHTPEGKRFSLQARPEFGLLDAGRITAFHVWNTKRPKLTEADARNALSLLPALYADDDVPPDDFAILSLREPKVYRLSELGCQPAAAHFTAADIEQRIQKILDKASPPPPPPPGGTAELPPPLPG